MAVGSAEVIADQLVVCIGGQLRGKEGGKKACISSSREQLQGQPLFLDFWQLKCAFLPKVVIFGYKEMALWLKILRPLFHANIPKNYGIAICFECLPLLCVF